MRADENVRRLGSRYVAPLVAAVMMIGITASATTHDPAQSELPPGGTFLDDDWNFAEGAIEAVSSAGITRGCAPQRYCPERILIRSEAAALIARILEPPLASTPSFPDVPSDAWYAAEVQALVGSGVITGHTDGYFHPDDPLTRAQMAQLLFRAFGGSGAGPSQPSGFADVPSEALYASSVDWLAQTGITQGCAVSPARYCPDAPVRRDQVAMFLARTLGLELRVPPKRIAPLNGLPVKGLDWDRRVMAVKIDDHRGARPQSGVDRADAVIETLVEGGLTRWTALFHQSDSTYVGPVRSLRPTDIGLLLPLSGTVAVSGGQQWIIDRAVAEGVRVLRERDARPALFRVTTRKVPHNLYGNTVELRKVATAAGHPDQPPPVLFEWGPMSGGTPATSISMEWSDPITVTWTWDGLRYRRWRAGAPHSWILPDGTLGQVSADSLIVLVAPLSELAPPPGVSGSAVPSLDTVGTGTAFVFANGLSMRGVWNRASQYEPFVLTTPQGHPLMVPPGVPWISVFPEGRVIGS
jgi:hypothetical protein